MHTRAILLSVALPALLVVSTWAQQSQKPSQPASEIQTLAQAALERARRLSDIRSDQAPAFRLKATFSFVGKDSKTVAGPDSQLPFRNSSLVLYLIVDTQGKPQDVRVSESGGKDFDYIAMTGIRTWRFEPATCDGEPIPAEINVAIHFRPN